MPQPAVIPNAKMEASVLALISVRVGMATLDRPVKKSMLNVIPHASMVGFVWQVTGVDVQQGQKVLGAKKGPVEL